MKAGHKMQRALLAIDYPIATTFHGCSTAYFEVISLPGAATIAWGQSDHIEPHSDLAEIQERHLREQAESKLPSGDQMRALIAKNHPPQSWYDEDFSGF
jgi:hypothetical protein